MKKCILALLLLLTVSAPVLAQTIEDAEEIGKSNDQTLGSAVTTSNCTGGEVCIERAFDRGCYGGMCARALQPAIQGGDIVGRVRAMFTESSYRNGDHILMTTCEAQFGPDRCWFTWDVYPRRGEQIGNYYDYSARDKDNCWRINQTKKFYTRADLYTGDGVRRIRIESDNIKYERACGGG